MDLDLWLLTACCAFGVFVTAILTGRRQRVEGGGSRALLTIVALAVATLAVAPLATLAGLEALATARPEVQLFGDSDTRFVAALAALAWVGIYLILHLKPLTPLHRTERALPELDDEEVMARVAELARAVGAPMPKVRVLGSIGGALNALAWAGGLTGPTLVLTDGILHRLAPAERDAIIAHELSHLARHTVWVRVLLTSATGVAGVCLVGLVHPLTAMGAGLALFLLLNRLRSRWDEVACDLRAARAVGHATLSRALDKIHAAHTLPNEGLTAILVYGTATHPHLAIRRDAVKRAAPPEEASQIDVDPKTVLKFRVASRAAFVIGWLVLLASLIVGQTSAITGLVLAATIPFTPIVFLSVALSRPLKLNRARLAGYDRKLPGAKAQLMGLLIFVIGLGVAGVATQIRSFGVLGAAALIALIGLVLLVSGAPRNTRARRLRRRVIEAYFAKDYAGALALGAASPDAVARDPIVRHNLALAAAVTGERERARKELTELGDLLPLATISLAAMLVNDEPEAALEIATRDVERLPNDPKPLATRARALRRLSRFDDAEEAVDAARALDPRDGSLLAIGASIAMARGQFQQAGDMLVEALRLAPGSAYPLYVRAELAEAAGEDWAPDAIAEALKAAKANPFVFLEEAVSKIGHIDS